jgi:ankyrin repeat protein
MAKWSAIKATDLITLNATLKVAGLPALTITTQAATPSTQPPAPASASQAAASDRADALSEAARRGDAAQVKELLDAGVDVDTKFRYNRTALSFAADRGHVDVVKLLVERGADINAKDTFYNATPLTWAVNPAMERKPQHVEVVRLLLAKGDVPADALSNALAAATQSKQEEIIALLKAAGAKPKDK